MGNETERKRKSEKERERERERGRGRERERKREREREREREKGDEKEDKQRWILSGEELWKEKRNARSATGNLSAVPDDEHPDETVVMREQMWRYNALSRLAPFACFRVPNKVEIDASTLE